MWPAFQSGTLKYPTEKALKSVPLKSNCALVLAQWPPLRSLTSRKFRLLDRMLTVPALSALGSPAAVCV